MLRTERYCIPWYAQVYIKTIAIYKERTFSQGWKCGPVVKRT